MKEGRGKRNRQKEIKVVKNHVSKKAKAVSFPQWLPLRSQALVSVHKHRILDGIKPLL